MKWGGDENNPIVGHFTARQRSGHLRGLMSRGSKHATTEAGLARIHAIFTAAIQTHPPGPGAPLAPLPTPG